MGILRADRITGLGGANAIKGSVFFDGASTLTVEDSDDFHYDTGDFTIEGWIFATGRDSQMMLLGQWDGAGSVAGSLAWAVQLSNDSSGFLRFLTSSTGTNVVLNQNGSSGTVFDNKWHHFAVTRNGNDYKLFTDGVVVASTTDSNAITNSPFPLTIGGSNKRYVSNAASSQTFTGFLSNIRIIKGEALYTAAFTPPTSELTITSNTVFLGCQSSNILREEKGKILSIDKSSTNDSGPISSKFTPNSPVGFSTTTDVGSQYGSTFDGFGNFATSTYMVPPGGNTRERNRGRAVMAGGMMYPTIAGEEIDMLEIQSGGLTQAFGDLTAARSQSAPMSSSTRGVIAGGLDGGTRKNEIDFVTIASTGNATDFGDVSEAIGYLAGVSNQTRGLICGGNGPSSPNNTNQIEYVTIATAGDSVDFGHLTRIGYGSAGSGSPTRGLIFGGYVAPAVSDTIDYVTIASTGNATDFGNATVARSAGASCSSSTRAIFGGGYVPSPASGTEVNTIDYVTIASTGDAQDFGDLSVVGNYFGATSNGTRGIFGSRMTNQPYTGDPTIDTVIIASKGNAVNWGDQNRMDSGPHDGQPIVRRSSTTMSDSHGGL